MKKISNTVVFILIFISIILIPQFVLAKTFEVSFKWEHSGKGMVKFIFSTSPNAAGPWVNVYPLMINNLTPTDVEGKTHWEGVVTLEAENLEDIQWWICYAESSGGTKSDLSEPVQAVYGPNQPHSLRKMKGTETEINQITVLFI